MLLTILVIAVIEMQSGKRKGKNPLICIQNSNSNNTVNPTAIIGEKKKGTNLRKEINVKKPTPLHLINIKDVK